jgi:hypothetical protein
MTPEITTRDGSELPNGGQIAAFPRGIRQHPRPGLSISAGDAEIKVEPAGRRQRQCSGFRGLLPLLPGALGKGEHEEGAATARPLDFRRPGLSVILPPVRPYRLALLLVVVGVAACCLWAPWVQVDSAFPAARASLGLAPIWTSRFRNFPGASVDIPAFATSVGLLTAIAALIGLGRGIRRS